MPTGKRHKLTAAKLRKNLMLSALYLSAYELLSYCIIYGVENYLWDRNVKSEWRKEFAAIKKVKNLEKKKRTDRFYHACYWLLSRQILTDRDIDRLEAIRDHRNLIAHQMTHILIDKSYKVDQRLLKDIHRYIKKIDTWYALFTIHVEPGTLNIIEPSENERMMMHARIVVLELLIDSVLKKTHK